MGEVALLAVPAAAGPDRHDATATVDPIPLVVDLDGTLVRTDTLTESVFVLAKQHPLCLLMLPFWALSGRARLKQQLARRCTPDARTLPYHIDLLDYLGAQKRNGRRLVLCTGADERIAREVGEALGLFDALIASDGATNLTGEAKRRRLVSEFGERGFDYVGNTRRDLPVWRSARQALVVDAAGGLEAAVGELTPVERSFGDGRARPGIVLQELRWHHGLKNLLVYLPLLAAHRLYDAPMAAHATLAFVGFCLAASSIYLLNDLIDLPTDRRHPRKKERPLASGRMPIGHAMMLFPLLWLGVAGVSAALPGAYFATVMLYVALMLAYSLWLKDLRVVDALLLSGGYALRLVAGAVALQVGVSPWLIAWCILLFFSLALLKRQAELAVATQHAGHEASARAYRPADAPMIAAVGRAAGVFGIAILALYPLAEPAMQPARWPIWCICALLLGWMLRLWRLAGQARIHDDPVLFALHDGVSRSVGLIVLMLLVVAT